MLEAIRKRAGSFVVKILFAILVMSFFIWGIADVFRPKGGTEWAAKVGDRKISTQALSEEYRAALSRLGSTLGSHWVPVPDEMPHLTCDMAKVALVEQRRTSQAAARLIPAP